MGKSSRCLSCFTSLCNLRCVEMHITAAAPRTTMLKHEPSPEPTFHLPDLLNDHAGADAATIVGWPLAPPPNLLGSTSSAQATVSSPSPATVVNCVTSTPEAVALPGFQPKRLNWTRRLVITKQPASEFYKDEGGKANALEVEVTLVEFNELGEPARTPDNDFTDIPLRILLFFESGRRVDDTDQEIFRFVGNDYDSVVIRKATRKASVQFRLEKVSRRKDGQRFKLRIEVDQEQCTANVADLTPVFTNAICVLSKRKHPSSYNSDSSTRAKEPPPKLLKRDLTMLEVRLSRKIDGLATQLHHLSQLVQKQNELLAKQQHMPLVPPPIMHCPPSDSSILELLLRSNTVEDGPWPKPGIEPQILPSTVMPYFEVADESFHSSEAELTPAFIPPPASTTVTTPSDTRTSETTTPSLPFGDI
ncbi:hypothetical protein F441_11659 [Phytophthora nicotianae CJ01A1]|uniref:Uncharacterized protein n=6 Tax=Phytophthora nicotianae TaxID=4792 RepID=W2Q252_PHYN3|nr:hypothetical protein PPTG_12923 [Phytophthora nicotianae INRA-310]ETI43294.1 hypothetical protein F443_11725 [Phytophthora nicotianae P1569]ETK83362.1 hypothetical protein L915_11415 [Phytophthora nicotianae]ETO71945.1 hypothetical protein F444_11809 [Phytophthora nicotianae P1976]ETP13077.1 hypothetical protein F441_11659 [Phytophthora nicotianae CJ01A1]ETL36760.1 hypothetical protein L916_11320 [Phytophthora nicotianae]